MPFPSPVLLRTLTPEELPSLALDDFEYASLLRTISPEIYNAISELVLVADGIYTAETWIPYRGSSTSEWRAHRPPRPSSICDG